MTDDVARCFVALVLDEATERAALRAQRDLPDRGVSLSRREAMHLTLKFMGDVSVSGVARPAFEELATHVAGPPIALGEGRLQAFPSAARASVLVLELADEGGRIATLARWADEAAASRGVAPETRAFRPHLTLGRCRRALDVRDLAARASPVPLGVATEVALFRSDRGENGARHTRLATVPFAAPQPA